jgi:hypothetical protein
MVSAISISFAASRSAHGPAAPGTLRAGARRGEVALITTHDVAVQRGDVRMSASPPAPDYHPTARAAAAGKLAPAFKSDTVTLEKTARAVASGGGPRMSRQVPWCFCSSCSKSSASRSCFSAVARVSAALSSWCPLYC